MRPIDADELKKDLTRFYDNEVTAKQLIDEQPTIEPEQRWIPIKAHPATDEEQESRPDIDYWFDCKLPDDGQEILVTVKHKNWIGVEKDVCYVDSCYSLDSGYDWLDDIVAWMPLPEPYQERGEQNGMEK